MVDDDARRSCVMIKPVISLPAFCSSMVTLDRNSVILIANHNGGRNWCRWRSLPSGYCSCFVLLSGTSTTQLQTVMFLLDHWTYTHIRVRNPNKWTHDSLTRRPSRRTNRKTPVFATIIMLLTVAAARVHLHSDDGARSSCQSQTLVAEEAHRHPATVPLLLPVLSWTCQSDNMSAMCRPIERTHCTQGQHQRKCC
jgi:hypothetical protein